MKKIIIQSLVLLCGVFFYACNEEWEDEQYAKYVAFVNSGVTNVYLPYDNVGGKVSYRIPLLVSGSTGNGQDVKVQIAIDPDTLIGLNKARFNQRTDLYFVQLAEKHYEFKTMETTIPKGSDVGYIDVDFSIGDLDLVDKHILPLNITATSAYEPSPKKWYRKSLMRIVPYNDYSGTYSATAGNVYVLSDGESTPMVADTREARVVDDKTIFFYAGVVEEELQERALYKIKARFDDDGTLTLTADSAAIDFKPSQASYTVTKERDELEPYLEKRYVTLSMKYEYDDLTNRNHPVRYSFEGSMVLERRRNTLIPEDQQQEIFD